MKKILKTSLFILLIAFSNTMFAQVQCDVDVVIAEGTSIQMCSNALVPINASGGFAAYSWTGPEIGANQSITPSMNGQYVVHATDAIGCISTDTIQVTILTVAADSIVSSNGDTLCGANGTTLSLTNPYVLYDWGGGITTPTLFADQPGNYSVNVADANNCVATFSIKLFEYEFDLEVVGGDPCAGSVTLMGSGGTTYSWSTGETTQSITVATTTAQNFSVTITEGSCMQTLTTTVQPLSSAVQFSLQDTFYVAGNEQLLISGPAGFSSYSWFPGNQIADTAVQVISFQGTETQNIYLQATHPSGCSWTEMVTIIVVNLDVPNGFSPNGDLMNDEFVIPELSSKPGKLVVWNRWGDIVFQSDAYTNNWSGTCESGFCLGVGEPLPEGTYFYQVDVFGITKEGYVTLKR